MALKKQATPKRWRSKEAKEIVAAVQRAGGQVERTASGHLKVIGPTGSAIVASAPNAGRAGWAGRAGQGWVAVPLLRRDRRPAGGGDRHRRCGVRAAGPCRLSSTLRALAAGGLEWAHRDRAANRCAMAPVAVPVNRWAPGRA